MQLRGLYALLLLVCRVCRYVVRARVDDAMRCLELRSG